MGRKDWEMEEWARRQALRRALERFEAMPEWDCWTDPREATLSERDSEPLRRSVAEGTGEAAKEPAAQPRAVDPDEAQRLASAGFAERSAKRCREAAAAARAAVAWWLAGAEPLRAERRPSDAEWSALWDAMQRSEDAEREAFRRGDFAPGQDGEDCGDFSDGGEAMDSEPVDEGSEQAAREGRESVFKARAAGLALRRAWATIAARQLMLGGKRR